MELFWRRINLSVGLLTPWWQLKYVIKKCAAFRLWIRIFKVVCMDNMKHSGKFYRAANVSSYHFEIIGKG